jgi:hypothetical protein
MSDTEVEIFQFEDIQLYKEKIRIVRSRSPRETTIRHDKASGNCSLGKQWKYAVWRYVPSQNG